MPGAGDSGPRTVDAGLLERQLTLESIQLGFVEPFTALMRGPKGFGEYTKPFFDLPCAAIALGEQGEQMRPEQRRAGGAPGDQALVHFGDTFLFLALYRQRPT